MKNVLWKNQNVSVHTTESVLFIWSQKTYLKSAPCRIKRNLELGVSPKLKITNKTKNLYNEKIFYLFEFENLLEINSLALSVKKYQVGYFPKIATKERQSKFSTLTSVAQSVIFNTHLHEVSHGILNSLILNFRSLYNLGIEDI